MRKSAGRTMHALQILWASTAWQKPLLQHPTCQPQAHMLKQGAASTAAGACKRAGVSMPAGSDTRHEQEDREGAPAAGSRGARQDGRHDRLGRLGAEPGGLAAAAQQQRAAGAPRGRERDVRVGDRVRVCCAGPCVPQRMRPGEAPRRARSRCRSRARAGGAPGLWGAPCGQSVGGAGRSAGGRARVVLQAATACQASISLLQSKKA